MFEPVSPPVVPGDDAGDDGCCAVTDLDCFVIEIFCKQPSLSENSWLSGQKFPTLVSTLLLNCGLNQKS